MPNQISVEAIPNMPHIGHGDDIGQIIAHAAKSANFTFYQDDIICVASKAVSTAEGRELELANVQASELAEEIHRRIPRKDARVIQAIIDETGEPDGSRLEVTDNFIAGWLPNGLRLTSAGVDKQGPEKVILLPENSDLSAQKIGQVILSITGKKVAVIITDSDGRVEKRGSTQLAIGLYGVPAQRVSKSTDATGEVTYMAEETTSDMLAAAAGLLMGQRGTNIPVVVIRGFEYEFDETSSIIDGLSRPGK